MLQIQKKKHKKNYSVNEDNALYQNNSPDKEK